MAKWTETMEELCTIVTTSLSRAVDKIHANSDIINVSDVSYIDALTHTFKSIKTVLAMEGYESPKEESREKEEFVRHLYDIEMNAKDEEVKSMIKKLITQAEQD